MKLLKNITKSQFTYNSLVLMLGTVFAQAVPFLLSPILTRIYQPENFGDYSLFVSYFNVAVIIIHLRYELAIMKPRFISDALRIIQGSIIIGVLLTLIAYVSLFALQLSFDALKLFEFTWLLPITAFLGGIYLLLSNWFTKNLNYKNVSFSKVFQSSSNSIVAIILGYFFFYSNGLIIGYIVGLIVAILFFSLNLNHRFYTIFSDFDFNKIKKQLNRYVDFPKHNTFSTFLNSVSVFIPLWYISYSFDNDTVGYFGLSTRIVAAPLMLISSSVSQVLYEKSTSLYNKGGDLHSFVKRLFFKMALIYAMPLVILILFSEFLFGFVFGETWVQAGVITKYICVGVIIQILVNPFTLIFAAVDQLKIIMKWQMSYFVVCLFVIVINKMFFKGNLYSYLLLFSCFNVIMYMVYFWLILKVSKTKNTLLIAKKL